MYAALALIAIIVFFASFGTYHYAHIPEETILNELYRKTTPNLIKKNIQCKYDEILESTISIESWEVPTNNDDFSPTGIDNGSYVPECDPAFSVAILGMLYNIGARRAIADQFPCLILHDVDLLPLDRANLYACTRQPRHMSASIDKFRYVLPYSELVGGALAIRADQYVAVDGFSNRFEGWGGEDDDMHARIRAHQLDVVRFPRTRARYSMLVHAQAPRNAERFRIMAEKRRAHADEGYRAAPYRSV
ncbi:Beta-1,4-galactosyltransferase, partial [Operophtera brumata]